MIFVDSEWLGRLMLTPQQAQGLAHALSDAADEGLPPRPSDLKPFQTTYRHLDPALEDPGRPVSLLARVVRRA